MTSDVAPGGSVIASECVLVLDSLDSHVPHATTCFAHWDSCWYVNLVASSQMSRSGGQDPLALRATARSYSTKA